ncbi:hypothetical protein BI49514_00316 [Brevibacterium iodinum ATCC 49514]|uniref:Uncharacterized protein n=1 Tax=Brevibacterium iodinum ATCC 49514 TaxID=1255616 RepID=A0A2H1HV33_9MICO|nr:hypothetical protein BI49514_00316 [Brevibacterium iodinum ATCC 49514]SUW13600.1 Uncharacterised protein [Brevibacterium iodinum]
MLSERTRRARSRLANAVRRGEDDGAIEIARTAYDIERARDMLHAIRGTTTPEQRRSLHDAVEATGGDLS